jgi:hypothetical protein
VSKARLDFPEPESPVIVMSLFRDGDVLEVVLPGAVNDELFLRHNLRVYRADQTGTCVRSGEVYDVGGPEITPLCGPLSL